MTYPIVKFDVPKEELFLRKKEYFSLKIYKKS